MIDFSIFKIAGSTAQGIIIRKALIYEQEDYSRISGGIQFGGL
jgi:hypothetical protein